jgi:cytochrome c-type biogenesis protein CcmH/NrfG
MKRLTDEEAARHNESYRRGWDLAKPHLLLGAGPGAGRLGWRARRELMSAIDSLQTALSIAPNNWPTLWALGKIYQRLHQPREALDMFERAYTLNPGNADILREAAEAAMGVNDGPRAVRYCEIAIAANPQDPGLVANLALAYLVDRQVDQALAAAEQAVERDPSDDASKCVLGMVRDVQSGRLTVPPLPYG